MKDETGKEEQETMEEEKTLNAEGQLKDDEMAMKEDPGQEAEGDTKEEDLCTIEEVLLDLEKEKKEKELFQERALRYQADFKNYKTRVIREREKTIEQANCSLIEGLLPIIDNLERAISSKPPDDDLVNGVQMILNQLLDYLAQEGLEEIEALGQPFDPCYHEAVEKVVKEGCQEEIIVQVLQKGYTFKGEVIRAAVVKVAG